MTMIKVKIMLYFREYLPFFNWRGENLQKSSSSTSTKSQRAPPVTPEKDVWTPIGHIEVHACQLETIVSPVINLRTVVVRSYKLYSGCGIRKDDIDRANSSKWKVGWFASSGYTKLVLSLSIRFTDTGILIK